MRALIVIVIIVIVAIKLGGDLVESHIKLAQKAANDRIATIDKQSGW